MLSRSPQEQRWQETIVDHSQFPRRHGRIEGASVEAVGENPLCGDRVQFYFQLGPDDRVQDVGFEATGCAISLASASLLAAQLVGRSRAEALALFEAVHGVLTGGDWPPEFEPGELAALALIPRFPLRVKCATLSWHAMRQALTAGSGQVSTE